jgi:hypothetical protein
VTTTLNLIAVPKGLTAVGKLALSIVVAPRLTDGRRLGKFGDMMDWTRTLAARAPRVLLRFGATVLPGQVDVGALQPDLWDALFDADTPVVPFTFDDASDRIVVSYRTRDALAAVKDAYQTVIAGSPGSIPSAVSSARRLDEMVLPQGQDFDALLAAWRLRRWRRRDDRAFSGMEPLPVNETVRDFALYYRMPQPDPRGPDPIPRTDEELRDILDFHRAVTALSAHPTVMRALGLVLDVEVDPRDVKPSGALGAALAAVSVEDLRIGRDFRDAAFMTPRVLYRYLSAAAGSAAVFATADDAPDPVIAEGYLNLDERQFHILDLDIDGAVAKLTSLATMLPRAAHTPTSDGALPALRSAGLSLAAHDRGREVLQALRRSAQINAALTAAPNGSGIPLAASDLVRGYRIDVWSSATGRWESLHRRDATYIAGRDGTFVLKAQEEGFAQFAAASPTPDRARPPASAGPPIESDLYVHEALARWTGWSLSAPRPGKAIHRSNEHEPLADDPSTDTLATAFPLRQTFQPVRGSLPRLRFGHRYRMRVRVVDIAGNSPPQTDGESKPLATPTLPVVLPPGPEAQPYYRYEPVPHPLLVLRSIPEDRRPALDRLVIRTFNSDPSLDTKLSGDSEERHVAPPRTSVDLAERHGVLDDPLGRLKGDAATFATIVARNDATFPTQPLGTPPQDAPIVPAAQLIVDYLPDPFARSASLRFLPGVVSGRVVFAGTAGLVDRKSDTQDAGPVVQVHFGDAWPEREAFRIVTIDGNAEPRWDAFTRVLTVSVPKATDVEVRLSSALADADLEVMGVWAWQREYLDRLAQELVAASGVSMTARLEEHARLSALLVRLALEGGQWALTPSIPVHFIHAVQQPLGRPAFVCASAGVPFSVRGSSLRANRRAGDRQAPLAAMRAYGSPDATLVGALDVHFPSTGRVDLIASWEEITDDGPDAAGVTTRRVQTSIEPIQLDRTRGAIPAQGSKPRDVAVVVAENRLGFLAERYDGAALVAAAAPIHRFGDSRHRRVTYRAVSTSRFQSDFPADQDLVFTRDSEPVEVSVPSSAKPPAPKILQVLPTFGWRRERTGTLTSSIRYGRGVRVYLNRPWFASGEGELLGVVLWRREVPPPGAAVRRDTLAGFVTEWGLDPLRRSGNLPGMPTLPDLTDAVSSMEGVDVPEAGIEADIAGYAVHAEGDHWYADITLAAEDAYMPFLRLALVRFQPESIKGAEISAVATAGFIQLTPDRSAVLITDPTMPQVYSLVVSGVAPSPSATAPWKNAIEVSIEERRDDLRTDLGWQAVAGTTAKVTPVTTTAVSTAVLFSGLVEFAVVPAPGRYRLVIREYETWRVDPASTFRRLVEGVDATMSTALLRAVPREQSFIRAANLTRLESVSDQTFVRTGRAFERLSAAIVGPPTGRRLVYAEFIAVEPPAGSKDFSRGAQGPGGEIITEPGAPGVGGPAGPVVGEPGGPVVGEPGGPVVGEPGGPVDGGPEAPLPDAEPADEPFSFAPQPGRPPSPFDPRWEEVPVVGPGLNPLVVSGTLKLAQSMLNTAVSPQPPLAIDGLFSPLTELAIRAIRTAAQLPDTGSLDLQGWLALASTAPFPVLEPGIGNPPMSGPPVALVQRLLNMNVDTDQIIEDGVFTTDTADRVRAFQTERGLPVTGIVDLPTWLEMATLFDLLHAIGAERVVLGFDRARSEAGGEALVLISRETLDDAALPPSDPLDEDLSNQTGLRVELQDSRGEPLFRLRLGHLLSDPPEVPTDPVTGASLGRPGPARADATLSFVLPVISGARRLVVFGTIDPNDRGPAAPIAVFEPF